MVSKPIQRIVRTANLDPHMGEVARGASVAMGLMALSLGLGFVFNVLLARILGAGGTGLYFLAFDTISIAVVFGRLGLDKMVLRTVAASAELEAWPHIARVYQGSVRLAALASGLMAAVFWMAAPILAEKLFSKPELTWPLRLMALALLPTSLLFLQGAAMRGLRRIRDSLFLESTGLLLFGTPLLIALAAPLGVSGAVLARVLAAWLLLVVGLVLWRRALSSRQVSRPIAPMRPRELAQAALPFFWLDSINLVMERADTLFLGFWATSEVVGVYKIALRTALLISFVVVAMNSIIAPKVAALHAQGDWEALNALARRSTRVAALAGLVVALPLFLLPEPILRFFGADFTAGATALRILAVGLFIHAATGPVGFLLMMSGHEKKLRDAVFFTAGLTIVLHLIFIPLWGMIGAALVSAVSFALKNLMAAYMVRRTLAIRIW